MGGGERRVVHTRRPIQAARESGARVSERHAGECEKAGCRYTRPHQPTRTHTLQTNLHGPVIVRRLVSDAPAKVNYVKVDAIRAAELGGARRSHGKGTGRGAASNPTALHAGPPGAHAPGPAPPSQRPTSRRAGYTRRNRKFRSAEVSVNVELVKMRTCAEGERGGAPAHAHVTLCPYPHHTRTTPQHGKPPRSPPHTVSCKFGMESRWPSRAGSTRLGGAPALTECDGWATTEEALASRAPSRRR